MKHIFQIILANIKNTFEHETAYFTESWSNILSTIFYTATMLVFITILYTNIQTFAGYSKNEMFFIVLVGQLAFYIGWGIFGTNSEILTEDINKGTLDFVLIKPVPSLFFVSFRKLPIVSVLRDGLPNVLIVSLLINWSALPVTFLSIVWGIIIFIVGQIIWHCIRLIFILPNFWLGNAKQIYGIIYELRETHNIPFEGYSQSVRIFFSTFVPIIILDAMSTSVILNRSDGPTMVLWATTVSIVFFILINWLWKIALRNYTSASS